MPQAIERPPRESLVFVWLDDAVWRDDGGDERVRRDVEGVVASVGVGRGDETCSFTLNEEYTELNAQVTKQCSAQQFLSDVEVVTYNAEIMQVFTGTEDWSVHFVVQNMNTGYELVNVQYPQEEWNITPDMWDE